METPALARPLPLAVGALAVARLTRLATEDKITERLRERLAAAASGRLAYFVTCPWCVSMWLAAGWAVFVSTAPVSAMTAGAVLAWSEVSGLAASVS